MVNKKNKKGHKKNSRRQPESFSEHKVTLNWYLAAYKSVTKLLCRRTPDGYMVEDGSHPPPVKNVTEPSWGSFQMRSVKGPLRNLTVMTILATPAGMFWREMPLQFAVKAPESGTITKIITRAKSVEVRLEGGKRFDFLIRNGGRYIECALTVGQPVEKGQIIAGPQSAPRMFRPRILKIRPGTQKRLERDTGLCWEVDTLELDRMYKDLPHQRFIDMTAHVTEAAREGARKLYGHCQPTWADCVAMTAEREREREIERRALQPIDLKFIDTVTDGLMDNAADTESVGTWDETGAPSSPPVNLRLTKPKYKINGVEPVETGWAVNKETLKSDRVQPVKKERVLPGHVQNNRTLVG